MVAIAREMVWLKYFLQDLGIMTSMLMHMHCDKQVTIFISRNFFFHERTKHLEILRHFIHEKVLIGVTSTPYMSCLD